MRSIDLFDMSQHAIQRGHFSGAQSMEKLDASQLMIEATRQLIEEFSMPRATFWSMTE